MEVILEPRRAAFRTGIGALICAVVCAVAADGARSAGAEGLKIRRSPVTALATFVTADDGGAISVELPAGETQVQPAEFHCTIQEVGCQVHQFQFEAYSQM